MASGATPDFEPSPARLTWSKAGTSNRRTAESESRECTSSQIRLTTFTLFDCRWPMKCQRNASPNSACFASRSCARFSPTTVTPASTSAAIWARGTYSVAATIVTDGPTSACTRSSRARISGGDGTDHALHAAGKAVAAVREEELGMVACAEVDSFHALDACHPQRALGGAPQVEPSLPQEARLEQPGDLGTDLVATRSDRRADDGRLRCVSESVDAGLDHTLGEASPARVQHREPPRAFGDRDGDRQAVGRHR